MPHPIEHSLYSIIVYKHCPGIKEKPTGIKYTIKLIAKKNGKSTKNLR